ncbi:phage integrase central domain-containing protein [Vibrio diazotrophicus]|uniref:phage integrase central domain-containing protein n=1 Tax=Vibrio diazotrophicus TaxID=685 RepID=UPI000C9E55FA|nr:tyrosine-type recombinase/integrase [Vibrio diazotrophicus]PNH91285.1 integrase [Vibrio diazotrophicus]
MQEENKKKRITDLSLKHAELRAQEYLINIGDGLYLRIRPNGTKSWLFIYSAPHTKKRTKISIGVFPSIKLANAKQIAAKFRQNIMDGTDPKQASIEEKLSLKRQHSTLFGCVAEEWWQRKSKDVTQEHANRIWRTLELYVLPALEKRPITEISRFEAVDLLRPVERDGKTSTVKRICQSLNQIMEFAIDNGITDINRFSGMYRAFEKHKVTHMPTLPPEQGLRSLFSALNSNSSIASQTKLLTLWQLNTIVRPKEAVSAKWEFIDLDKRTWTVDTKSHENFEIPLNDNCMEILEIMHPISCKHSYVFPSFRGGDLPMSKSTVNAALKRSLGFKAILVSHGFRSIASTALHKQFQDKNLAVEACLAHLDSNEVRRTYNNNDYFEERVNILDWWSDYLNNLGTLTHMGKNRRYHRK